MLWFTGGSKAAVVKGEKLSGAIYKDSRYGQVCRDVNDASTGANAWCLSFDAHRSNDIYGASTEIRPPNRNYLPIIKASYEQENYTGDQPLLPDVKLCTFIVNPVPSNATVQLRADGYVQQGNSITVVSGTEVKYGVYLDGYEPKEGVYTVDSDVTYQISLELGMVIFEITTNVDDAVITLTADGYVQDGNQISVKSGTKVAYSVVADGYYTESGTYNVTVSYSLDIVMQKLKYNTVVKTLQPTTIGTYDSADVGKSVIRSDADTSSSLITKLFNGFEWYDVGSYTNASDSVNSEITAKFAKSKWSGNKTKMTLWVGHTEINQASKIIISLPFVGLSNAEDYLIPSVYGTNDGGTWTPLTIATYNYTSASIKPPVPPYSKKYDTAYPDNYYYYIPFSGTSQATISIAQSQSIVRLTLNMDTSLNASYYLHKIVLQVGNGKTNLGTASPISQLVFTTNVKTVAPR
jgi:hypothetical protein